MLLEKRSSSTLEAGLLGHCRVALTARLQRRSDVAPAAPGSVGLLVGPPRRALPLDVAADVQHSQRGRGSPRLSSRTLAGSTAGRLCFPALPSQQSPAMELPSDELSFRSTASGRPALQAPLAPQAAGVRSGRQPRRLLGSRASDGGVSGAIFLLADVLGGTCRGVLVAFDRGGSAIWCSGLAVGVGGWCWWIVLRKGRRDGQRSRLRASRRNCLHVPWPSPATGFCYVIKA